MSNPSSPTLNEVIGNVVEEVMRENAEERNQETVFEVVPEEIEVVVEEGEVRAFNSNKGEEAFKKHLAKKGYVEERGFKQLVSPFKEEVEQRSWETLSQHMELGRRVLVKEFYANLGEQKDLECYVRGRWIPFGKRAISQILGLRQVGECVEYEQL